jgi:hypothetical protein
MGNYQGYSMSNARNGFSMMRQALNDHEPCCDMPTHIQEFAPDYPVKFDGAQVIDGYRMYIIIGRQGHKVECVPGEGPPATVFVDEDPIRIVPAPFEAPEIVLQ